MDNASDFSHLEPSGKSLDDAVKEWQEKVEEMQNKLDEQKKSVSAIVRPYMYPRFIIIGLLVLLYVARILHLEVSYPKLTLLLFFIKLFMVFVRRSINENRDIRILKFHLQSSKPVIEDNKLCNNVYDSDLWVDFMFTSLLTYLLSLTFIGNGGASPFSFAIALLFSIYLNAVIPCKEFNKKRLTKHNPLALAHESTTKMITAIRDSL